MEYDEFFNFRYKFSNGIKDIKEEGLDGLEHVCEELQELIEFEY